MFICKLLLNFVPIKRKVLHYGESNKRNFI